ncbi:MULTISPECIES: M15 family metallopeptidase [Vagococcus]|uniref:D-alanyl-D-alanine carboxypeptidase n=1 Tax=Vagococcus fluvialis bH819 TaxID=1255619 RepID=A0A1X6WM22_9ENTE|nr:MULTISPECIES: M15 family metallopeptidase [Vagococcus]SLM85320.1 D-alanyl-D-alanine carboxypeptidase [Vagococcus fluvialis bH819]HCM89385.1 D-alanyl-D-alanine carboxypeptidase family protein [Vagococcus sp.]
MAKKIFIIITCLFVGLAIIFHTQKSNKDKKETTTISTEQVVKKEESHLPGKLDDWNLILVNNEHQIKEEPTNLKELPDGHKVDSRIHDEYLALSEAAAKAGFELTIISSYRSVAEQEEIVARDIQNYLYQDYSESEAKELAMKYLTVPGLSEHHTGLALDVLDVKWYEEGNMLEEEFGETDAGKWLDENVNHYGFVIRYKKGKEKLTGINYEPWHIRYVGKENAEYMTKNQLVLEEYIEQLKKVGK